MEDFATIKVIEMMLVIMINGQLEEKEQIDIYQWKLAR